MVKNYVLDTNLLLDNPNVIFGFKDNNVYITGTTLQELDHHKKDRGERGFNARECGRILAELSERYGNLTKGVPLPNEGRLFTMAHGVDEALLPKGFSITVPDNRIISACKWLEKNSKDKSRVILLSNDTYMRINASACGVQVQSVRNDRIEDSNYTGHRTVILPDPYVIDLLYRQGTVEPKLLLERMREDEMALTENEFITLQSGQSSALSVFRRGKIELIPHKTKHIYGDITPRNAMQNYALWALMNPEIELVILKGPAGTAKTFLSLAAGLSQSYLGQRSSEDLYQQIMISRPNVEGSDPGFGFLPGDLDEKMAPLLASYYDNLEILINRTAKGKERLDVQKQIDDLFASGAIDICPLNYIRGRSLKEKYLICDEAQNANAQLIKAVVTRAGAGTKIIVAGDPDQCDAPHLDKYTNGLVYVAEAMKGAPNTVILRFGEEQCERSNLAKIAIERMR